MKILKSTPVVSKVLPQHFHHRLPKDLKLKLLANNRNLLAVVKGLSRRIHLLSLIISLTHTLRISIMAHPTILDTFLNPSSSTPLSFNLDHLDQDPLVILRGNNPLMLAFSLRHLTTGACINKQDTTIIKHINTPSTNISTRRLLV